MVILGEVLVAGGSALVVCSAIFWAWSAIKQKLGDFSAYQHHTIISRLRVRKRGSLPLNQGRTAWPNASKKATASQRSLRKRRSKQSLQRRAKRARRRVGNRRSDQARRNKKQMARVR